MAASFDPGAIFSNLIEGYIKLPLVQKIVFPLLTLGAVVGIIFVSKWANTPDYAVLFTDLQPTDSAAVIERLKTMKIEYEVRADGKTIAIRAPQASTVHEVRLSLAGEGIPKDGRVGLEIFDAVNFGATNFQEKIWFQRAVQGELERTIAAIEGVMGARVHITQPEKSVFAKRAANVTASVMLRLRPGFELDKKQIKGITNLVAGSVEGLARENVTIVDTFGNLLTQADENEESLTVEATRLTYQRDVEKGYVQRIEQMLSKVLGNGKVVARVTADLDFSSNERQEESYDPGGQVIRSERTVSEGLGSQQRGGVPGVVSNISNDPNLLAPKGTSEGGLSQHSEQIKNYEVSKAVTKVSSPRGRLTRLSVAVLVDGVYETVKAAAAPAEGAAPAKQFKPLDSEMLAQIESVVKSAVGFDAARGDTITVENVPFATPEVDFDTELKTKANQDFIFQVLSWALPAIFILLFFFVGVKPLVRFLVTPTEAEVDLSRLLPTGIKELEAELDTERSKAAIPAFEPSVDLEQLEELMAENSRIVKENPRQAALLIRYWLNDGRL